MEVRDAMPSGFGSCSANTQKILFIVAGECNVEFQEQMGVQLRGQLRIRLEKRSWVTNTTRPLRPRTSRKDQDSRERT